MSEYTYADLIVNPETPNVENLIGKEVYYNSVPSRCVSLANRGLEVGILREIRKDDYFPFCVETQNGDTVSYICYSCIIPKKEEPKPEPKYAPFESKEEFVERYTEVKEEAELGSFNNKLFQCGMWLKEKGHNSETYCMVTEIWESGVVVGNNAIATGENTVIKDFTLWESLYLGYTFPDGSPCGKEKK